MQRQHIYEVIKEHEAQVIAQGGPSRQASNTGATRLPRQGVAQGTSGAASKAGPSFNSTSSKRRRTSRRKSPAVLRNESSDFSDDDVPIKEAKQRRRATMPAVPVATTTQESSNEVEVLSTSSIRPECTDDKPSASTAAILSSSEIAATTLLVSTSNQPCLAPVHVPFRKCPTHKKLFETLDTLFEELATMGYFQGTTARNFDMVSTTHTWVDARQLMRRGNDDDWEVFLRTLERAWKKMGKFYEGDDCKINLLVHVKG